MNRLKKLKQRIALSIARRLAGYAGVAGAISLDDDVTQIISLAGALITLIWSVVDKIRDYKKGAE